MGSLIIFLISLVRKELWTKEIYDDDDDVNVNINLK